MVVGGRYGRVLYILVIGIWIITDAASHHHARSTPSETRTTASNAVPSRSPSHGILVSTCHPRRSWHVPTWHPRVHVASRALSSSERIDM